MFEKFNPLEDKMLQILNNDGDIIAPELKPEISDEKMLEVYKKMLFGRTADLKAVSYQRQGRMYTYPPNLGQEAVAMGAAMVIKEEDWVVPAFREMILYLEKGLTLKDIFLLFKGHEDGGSYKNGCKILPISIPIASQLPYAVGLAQGIKYKGEKDIVYTFVGDGGTSEGDFHEALNFAAVWNSPVIFVIQNNQYAISVPVSKQTKSINLAVKANAYGIKGIKSDGNDIFAMYKTYLEAEKYVREGNGPILIEAYTYRKGAHTTSDDPSRYRTKEEEKKWEEKDPLTRLKKYLEKKEMLDDFNEEELVEEYKEEIDKIFEEVENYPSYKLEDVFKYQYEEMPDDLKKQMMAHEKFLNWKEGNK